MKERLTSALFLIVSGFTALQAGTIRGRVVDASDHSPIPSASVYIEGKLDIGTDADTAGYFTLHLPDGKYTICCDFLGYISEKKNINLKGSATVNFKMQVNPQQLNAVVVSASGIKAATEIPQMSVSQLDVRDLMKMPALFGEQDVIKTLQLMPGVKSESDASSGFQVRGGESSQNLILLDGATINNAGHLLGFFSTFNSDILRDVTLYKGQMPAQYGGRISSVLDLNTINGDNENFHGDGSLGLLASKLCLQGPIQKGKSSFYISGRRTYLDLFLKATDDYKNTTLYFYDVNAKVNFNFGKHDNLMLSVFNDQDVLGIKNLTNMKWGSTVVNSRWSHRFNDDLDLNSNLSYSHYITENWMDVMEVDNSYTGKIDQYALNENLKYTPDSVQTFSFGLQSTFYDVISAEWKMAARDEKEERYAWENHFWANDEWQATKRLSLLGGCRLAVFSVLGGAPYYSLAADGTIADTVSNASRSSFVKTYLSVEPRLSANYKLTSHQSVKAAYSRTSQNIHSIKEGITSMPMDRYTLSTNLIEPETADQFSVGYAATIANKEKEQKDAYEVQVEAYYKKMHHILDYRDGVTSTTDIEIDRLLLAGQGISYGVELNLKKNHGRLTGWISYTLSKTETQIDGINNGNWYTSSNDRRHNVDIVLIYALSKKWDFSASWIFNSGQAMSIPTAKYEINGTTLYYYSGKNNYRAPDYHRLDLSATWHLKKHNRWEHELSFGLYNAYGRYNPFMISFEDDENSITGTKATQTSLFSFVPSISYRFKF